MNVIRVIAWRRRRRRPSREPLARLTERATGRGVLQGYRTVEEALRTVLDYGVTTQGLSHVMGVADAPNKGSRKLQEKMGFVWQREIEGDAGPLVIYKWVPA